MIALGTFLTIYWPDRESGREPGQRLCVNPTGNSVAQRSPTHQVLLAASKDQPSERVDGVDRAGRGRRRNKLGVGRVGCAQRDRGASVDHKAARLLASENLY